MTGLLNIVKALLWVLDYVRKNPKKSAVAGVGAGAMAFYAGAGVPTGPYFWPSGTPTEGYVVTADANGQPAWEENAGGGGGGDPVDGTMGDGQVKVFDDTANEYIPTQAGAPVYSVKNPISYDPAGSPAARMVRAAGSMQGTTGTINVASNANSMTVAASWDGARGHGIKVLGAGASHGLSAPAVAAVIPMTLDRAATTADAPVTFTTAHNATASLERIVLSEQISVPDGTIARLSNQGGTLPTYVTTTAFVETTAYYWRNRYEIQTVAFSGSATGGTYRVFDGDNPLSSVSVAYNASSATLQTALRTMTGWGSVTVSEAGSSPNYTHTITFVGLPGNRRSIGIDARGLTGGTPIITLATTANGGGMLYPTSGDAVADTNAYDIDGAGTGTHYIVFEGATSYEYDASAMSGAYGWTDDGADATTTTGHATINAQLPNRVFVDCVTGAKGGYAIFGDSTTDGNRYIFATINELQTCVKIVADAGGYTSLEYGDLGRTLVQGSHDGVIVGFSNSTRTIWVTPNAAADTFPGGAAVSWTITSGAGSGTQTSAATSAAFWDDCGATATYSLTPEYWDTYTCGPYRRVGRMSSTIYKPGDWYVYPLSSSAQWYLVVDSQSIPNSSGVRGNKSAAVAPSYDTAYGATTRDGDLTVMRIDRPCPTTLPSAAVNDALDTTVTDVSGTTVTVADAASTSVTSQSVLHDDTWAALAHYGNVRDSGQIAKFEWGEGRFPLYTGVIGTDPRYTSIGSTETLFPCYPSSGSLVQRTIWDMNGASLFWMPGDVCGALGDGTDPVSFMLLSKAHQTIRGPGRFICAAAEPHLERVSGYNQFHFSQDYTNGDNEIYGPYISDVHILGFPRPIVWNVEYDNEDAPVLRDVHIDYGYAGNDGGVYMAGGLISGGSLMGLRGFDCSVAIYQDFNNTDQAFTITDGFFGAYWRQNGFRIRQSDVKIHGCTFYMCQQLFVSEIIDGLSIQGNYLYETDIILGADTNTKIIGNTTIDSQLTMNVASINPIVAENSFFWNASAYAPTVSQATVMQVRGIGADVHDNVVDARGRGLFPGVVDLSGTGSRIDFHDNEIRSAGGQQQMFKINGTGLAANVESNTFKEEFFSTNQQGYVQTAGVVVFRNNDWQFNASTGSILVYSGSDVTWEDRTNGLVDFSTGITGPLRIGGGARFQGSTTIIAEANSVIQGANFAVAPTLSGATLFTSGNSVADVKSATVNLSASTNNDVALPVTDQVRLDAHASNSIVTSFVARADGTEVTIICVDASSATVTIDSSAATGTAANKIMCPGDTDIVMSSGERIVIRYDATTSLWYVIGGQYVAMLWDADAIRLWQQDDTPAVLREELWHEQSTSRLALAA